MKGENDMKRKLVLFMLFVIALSSLAETIASGTCGKDDPKSVRWELSDDRVLNHTASAF